MTYSSPGTYSAYMSHFKMPWGTSHKLQQEQYVSAGETVAIMNNVFDYRTIDGARSQTCTKLDLTKYEYIGLSPAPRADL